MPRSAPVPAPAAGVARRTVLKAGAVGAAALGIAGLPPTAASAAGPVFRHGVASGDPLGDRGRAVDPRHADDAATPGSGRGAPVDGRLGGGGRRRLPPGRAGGDVPHRAARDHTVQVDVTGLTPYTRYFYRFRALGATSPVGPHADRAGRRRVHALRLAFVRCSQLHRRLLLAPTGTSRPATTSTWCCTSATTSTSTATATTGTAPTRWSGSATTTRRRRWSPSPTTGSGTRSTRPTPTCRPPTPRTRGSSSSTTTRSATTPTTRGRRTTSRHRGRLRRAPAGGLPGLPGVDADPAARPGGRAPGTRFWRRFSFGPLADLSVLETRQNRSEQVAGAAGALRPPTSRRSPTPPGCSWSPPRWPGSPTGLAGAAARAGTCWATRPSSPGSASARRLPGAHRAAAARHRRRGSSTPTSGTATRTTSARCSRRWPTADSDVVVLTGDIHSTGRTRSRWTRGPRPREPVNNSVASSSSARPSPPTASPRSLGDDQRGDAATTGLQAENPLCATSTASATASRVLDVTPERVQCDFFHVADREDPQATVRFAAAWQSAFGTRTLTQADRPVGAAATPGGAGAPPRPPARPAPTAGAAAPRRRAAPWPPPDRRARAPPPRSPSPPECWASAAAPRRAGP